MYLPLMAVLVNNFTGERHAMPLVAPGLDVAAQMLRKAHPALSLLGLYDRETLTHWLDLLRHPAGTVAQHPVIVIDQDPADPTLRAVPTVSDDERVTVQANVPHRPACPVQGVFSASTIEQFTLALDRMESRCMRCAA